MGMVTIPTDSLVAARSLFERWQKGKSFQDYVFDRLPLVIPAGVVYVVLVTAGVAATIAFMAGKYSAFVLPTFIIAPFLLVGGYAVAAYLFFSWLEALALRHALKHDLERGALPRIPWILIGVFLGVPLLVLATFWWKVGLPLIALAVATPFLYLRFDRVK